MRKYEPINCEFHDVLESLATQQQPTEVVYLDADGVEQKRTAALRDVFARDGAEYLALASGETVRLDALVSVDGKKPSDF